MIFRKNKRVDGKGFTLIELLVVISIIAVLSSVVLASLNSARAKAREARRKTDLRQIEKALQLYYDANGSYPAPGDGWDVGYNYNVAGRAEWLTLQTNLTPYISKLPTDPSTGDNISGNGYMYYANNVPASGPIGQGYTLIAFPSEVTEPNWSCTFGWYTTNYPNTFLCIYQ